MFVIAWGSCHFLNFSDIFIRTKEILISCPILVTRKV